MSEARSISRSGVADRVDVVSVRTRRRRWSLRQLLIALAAGLSLILAGLYGDYWWNTGRFLVTTDDAYVDAHSALIAPQVSGYIIAVPVGDNQRVHAGQLLARIDPRLDQPHSIRPHSIRRAPMSWRRGRASTRSASRSPSKGSLLSRIASRLPRIRRRSSIRSRTTSATPSWPRTAGAQCRMRSRQPPTFAKSRPRCSATLRVLLPGKSRSRFTRRSSRKPRRRSRNSRRSKSRLSLTSDTPRSWRRLTASSACAR